MIRQADYADILLVATTMRDSDAREIYATRATDDPADVARQASVSPYAFVYGRGRAAIAAFGAFERWPGVWSIWLFANDLWSAAAARAVVRFVHRLLRTEIAAHGAHRLECKSLASHRDAHRFIRALGLRPEAELPGYGRAGETFISFSRVSC